MSGERPANDAEIATALTSELRTAAEGLKRAIATYIEAHDMAAQHLEDTNSIPKPPQGLDEELNDLYKEWASNPSREELEGILILSGRL